MEYVKNNGTLLKEIVNRRSELNKRKDVWVSKDVTMEFAKTHDWLLVHRVEWNDGDFELYYITPQGEPVTFTGNGNVIDGTE